MSRRCAASSPIAAKSARASDRAASKHHRQLAREIKSARYLALQPYTDILAQQRRA